MSTDATGTDDTGYRQLQYRRPDDATEILLVRHGESAPARAGGGFELVDGQGDPPLHAVGEEQAVRVGERLAGEDLAALYVTTLRRTVQTAAPLAARLGITPVVEPDLREVHLGAWDGGAYRQHVVEGHPLALRLMAEERWDVIPGAEPADAFADRVRGALTRIAAAHPGQRVAAFTHGGVIGQALALAASSRPFAFLGADNGSISMLVISPQRWGVRRYNDTAHLERGFQGWGK